MKQTKWAVATVVLFGLLSAGTLVMAAGLPAPRIQESALVNAIREQVELLKWVGGAMVTGLVAAVGWLWSSLNKERSDSKRLCEKSAESDDRLATAVERLTDRLNDRPCLLKEKD